MRQFLPHKNKYEINDILSSAKIKTTVKELYESEHESRKDHSLAAQFKM